LHLSLSFCYNTESKLVESRLRYLDVTDNNLDSGSCGAIFRAACNGKHSLLSRLHDNIQLTNVTNI